MPKLPENGLTPLETSLINALCLAQSFSDIHVGVRGRGVAIFLGGEWSTSRHKVMVRLAENGYVTMFKFDRAWYYVPTPRSLHIYNQVLRKLERGIGLWCRVTTHKDGSQ